MLPPIRPRRKRLATAPQAYSLLLRLRLGLAVSRKIRLVLMLARNAAIVPRVAMLNLRKVNVLPTQRDGGDLTLVAVGIVNGELHSLLVNQLPQRIAAGDAVRLIHLGRINISKADATFGTMLINNTHRIAIVHAGNAGGVVRNRLGAANQRQPQRKQNKYMFNGLTRLQKTK